MMGWILFSASMITKFAYILGKTKTVTDQMANFN